MSRSLSSPYGAGEGDEEFSLPAHPAFRTSPADRRHAATIARHIRAAGHRPTPTVILRLALAYAARELDPPRISEEVAAKMFTSHPPRYP